LSARWGGSPCLAGRGSWLPGPDGAVVSEGEAVVVTGGDGGDIREAAHQPWSALDHYYKGFGRHSGVGVEHAKPVTTRLPKLHLGDEPARLVGLHG
jgi:hypothetical protein